MIRYLLGRVIQYIFMFFIVMTVIFVLPRLLPGDPIDYLVPTMQEVTEATKMDLIRRYGLDKTPFEQYWLFFANTFTGYLGISWKYYPRDVASVIMERLPWTLLLTISGRILSFTLAFLLGVFAAWKRGTKVDVSLQLLFIILMSLPSFWFGMTLLMFFGYSFPIFPTGGSVTPGRVFLSFWEFAHDVALHSFLPIITLTLIFGADALVMRNTMVGVLSEDYILTAEAKGLTERTLMLKYGARNALLPFATRVAISFGHLASGFIFVETIFSYPGMGLLMWEAIFARDFPLIQGILILTTILVIIANFVVDLLYSWLDPRIKTFSR